MRVNFIIAANSAFFDGDNNLNIIGIFDSVQTQGFPALKPTLSIITSVNGKKDFNQKLVFHKEGSEEIIFENTSDIKVKPGTDKANVITNIENFPFYEEGRYEIKIYIDSVLQANKTVIQVNKI